MIFTLSSFLTGMERLQADHQQQAYSLFRVNALKGELFCPDAPRRDLAALLEQHLAGLPKHAPIVVMVHGAGYSPARERVDPHASIFAGPRMGYHQSKQAWPTKLADASSLGGLAICFAWDAHSGSLGTRLRNAYDRAGQDGARLAKLLGAIAKLAPTRPVDLFCHAMGARVALSSLAETAACNVARIILLGAAEFGAVALRAVSEARSRQLEIYNVISAQNGFCDQIFAKCVKGPGRLNTTLSNGFQFERQAWLDVDIDAHLVRHNLRRLGVPISVSSLRACAGVFLNNRGLFDLYSAILERNSGFDVAQLRQDLRHPIETRQIAPQNKAQSPVRVTKPAHSPIPLGFGPIRQTP